MNWQSWSSRECCKDWMVIFYENDKKWQIWFWCILCWIQCNEPIYSVNKNRNFYTSNLSNVLQMLFEVLFYSCDDDRATIQTEMDWGKISMSFSVICHLHLNVYLVFTKFIPKRAACTHSWSGNIFRVVIFYLHKMINIVSRLETHQSQWYQRHPTRPR